MVLVHILTALTSVGFTIYLYFSPSVAKLRIGYGLLASTIGTGTILVLSTHSPILQSCMTGLAFVGISLAGILLAKRKMAEVKND